MRPSSVNGVAPHISARSSTYQQFINRVTQKLCGQVGSAAPVLAIPAFGKALAARRVETAGVDSGSMQSTTQPVCATRKFPMHPRCFQSSRCIAKAIVFQTRLKRLLKRYRTQWIRSLASQAPSISPLWVSSSQYPLVCSRHFFGRVESEPHIFRKVSMASGNGCLCDAK